VGRQGAIEFKLEDFYTKEQLEEMDAGQNNPQDATFWPGMIVTARVTSKKIKNALPYEIVSFAEKEVTLRLATEPSDADDDDESVVDTEIRMPFDTFFKSFRMRYALTYASVQGLTIAGLLALHDTAHARFDRRKLFVGASRAKTFDQLVVY
jgi:hypothetical protein